MVSGLKQHLRVFLLGVVILGACDCGDPLATVVSVSGAVERDFAASVNTWESASEGAKLDLGDGVRTSAGARASLALASGAQLEMEPETLIRFRAEGNEGDSQLEVMSGEVMVEATAEGIELAVNMGEVRLDGGSRARVRADQVLEVLVGEAVIERQGTSQTVGAGQRAQLVGPPLAPLEALDADAAPAIPADRLAPNEEEATEDAGVEEPDEDTEVVEAPTPPTPADRPVPLGPLRADLELSDGSSIVIHSPTAPVRVAVNASACEGEAVLRVGRRRSRSEDSEVRISLPAGRHNWSLLCDGDSVASGRARILRDAGRRRMPRIPPRTVIDVDGRPYRVLYQNQLPEVLVRWPQAGGSGPYTVTLTRGGSTVTRTAPSARFEFRSGQVREGTHTIRVRSANGESSPSTRLQIRFDNAAPTASVTAPESGSFSAGQTVEVSGTAAPGWSVRSGGQELVIDDQYRFNAQVATPAGRDSLALRLSHPSRGTHYYLRRASGS